MLFNVAWAQERTVTGTVTSAEEGVSLPGVNVVVQGTTIGTTTDVEGEYSVSVPEGSNSLVFSFIGYATQEVAIGNRSVIDVQLGSDVRQLTEVVVTALGVSRERQSIGYSVQEISGAGIAQAAEPNMINALQGQVAGVQIQGAPGAMGGSSRITIRGVNSFLGENQPLFVVDGMPINNDNYATTSQLTGFGGGAYDYGNAASDINSMDIETMSVLKGTAATALYGTRGANGVILITTKSGRRTEGIGIDVNSITTFESPLALMPHQQRYGGGAIVNTPSGFQEFTENGQQYFAPVYSKDGAWGPAYDPNRMVRHWDSWDPGSANYGEIRPWVAPANGYESFFETGTTLQNSIGLSAGNEQGDIRLSYTNLTTAGIIPNSNLARNTISLNANYNLTDRLSIFTSGSAVRQDASGRNATGYDNTNPMQGFTQWWQTQLDVNRLQNYMRSDGQQYTWNPTGIITDDEGELTGFNPSPYFFDNPYFVRHKFLQEDTRDRLFGTVGVGYEIADGFRLSLRAMRDGFTFRTREAVPIGSVLQSSYNESTRTFNETNLEAKLIYERQLNENFSINSFIGGNLMDQERNRISTGTVGGLVLPGFYNIANSSGNPSIETEQIRRQINSVFGFASLGFFNTVYVDLSIRGDWSSTLPAENNNFWYPSISTSFVFSEIPALRTNFISFGKLRAGYGTAGNDANPYRLQNVYTAQQPNFGESPRYTVPVVRNNPNLRPEFTHEFEVGLEMSFLRDRLGFDFSYYDRTTRDQIFSVASSAATGFNSRVVNAGSMRNSGIELMLRATPVLINDFAWEVNLNFATFNNEVVELAEGVDNIILGSTWAAHLSLEEGMPYMALMGQEFQTDEQGRTIVGANGIPLRTPDRRYLGSAIADFAGGIRNSFSWRGIVASALVDFQGGGIIHSTSLQWAKYSGMDPVTAEGNIREEGMVIDGVLENGEVNNIAIDPAVYYQTIWGVAAPNVFAADFVKLRELRLGYTLPQRFLGRLPFHDVNISFIGRNLSILHSKLPYLDPQGVTGTGNIQGLENAQVPTTRSLGFNVSFKL